jgi:hypothetical protein
MKVVIQCAASKHPGATRLRTRSGDEVVFVATPELCDSIPSGVCYVRPDDTCEEKAMTWRNALKRYNEEGRNPYKLYRAADLYTPKSRFANCTKSWQMRSTGKAFSFCRRAGA